MSSCCVPTSCLQDRNKQSHGAPPHWTTHYCPLSTQHSSSGRYQVVSLLIIREPVVNIQLTNISSRRAVEFTMTLKIVGIGLALCWAVALGLPTPEDIIPEV